MQKFKINILINRLDLFTLIDTVNESKVFVDDKDNVSYETQLKLLLTIQPDDHLICVQSNDDKLYDILNELDIPFTDKGIDYEYKDKLVCESKCRLQSSSNSDNVYAYTRHRQSSEEE